jgi:plastocyanin
LPGAELNDARLNRRRFLLGMGTSAAGLVLVGSGVACGGDGAAAGPDVDEGLGSISGRVVDEKGGAPRPVNARVYLLGSGGSPTGRFTDVDATARFRLVGLQPGDYQLRFHAPGIARVPPHLPHPVRCTVRPDGDTAVVVPIELGVFNPNMVEIYCGDDFYFEQPTGVENGETVVRLGTVVCWYNVGLHPHTVTGGPWGDSGQLPRTASFIWIADQIGTFGYRCKYHLPDMQATLRVTA